VTFTAPEENTLGAIVGNARRRVSNTARRIGRASAHRGTLGTAFLGLGATIVVGLRAVYGVSWFAGLWSSYPLPFLGLAAWLVLGATIVGTILASRAVGDLLPDWMFAVFLAGIAASIALDVVAVWDLHDIGRNATAGLAAGMTLLLLVTRRGRLEVLVAAGVVGVGLAVLMFLDAPADAPVDADWIAPQVTGLALAALPPVVGVVIVETFRRLVQVELDRVLVQSTVSAPRFAVGMLASEELARLDLAAEELLDSVADRKVVLPLIPKNASIAAQLATELRLHLIEGRRETWLYHAISESELLGKSVTLVDKSALAGLLDPSQRDGLLSTAWLLVSENLKPAQNRAVTIQLGPVAPAGEAVPERKILVPITITTSGIARNRVDLGVWDALGRVGRYSDSTQDASLRVDIQCLVDNPAEQ
jgi:hypothetical protein